MTTREKLLAQFSQPINVLDHGVVQLIDLMGDDAAVVQAARVSTGGEARTPDQDRKLIRYLMRNQHHSPFEMASIKFRLKLPIFIHRQLVRHRVSKMNELSGRYSVLPDEMYVPDPEVISSQSTLNRQGREAGTPDPKYAQAFINTVSATQRALRTEYETLITCGYARELARIELPVAQYTECYWKMDLRNLLHFIHLRMDHHAQYEIQVYARAMAEIVKAWVPITWEAFEDYVLDIVTFSKPEVEMIHHLVDRDESAEFKHRLSDREMLEFRDKLKLFGLTPDTDPDDY